MNRAVAAIALAALASSPVPAGADSRTINVAVERRSGEKTRGPVTLHLERVNLLRYDALAGVSVTFTGGPDLRLPLIPPIPAAGAAPAAGERGSAILGQSVESLLARLARLESDRLNSVQREIDAFVDDTNAARRALASLVSSSDGVLRAPDGPAQLVAAMVPVSAQIAAANAKRWPTGAILSQQATLALLRTDVAGLPTTGLTADQQKTYHYIAARIPVLEQWYGTVGAQGEIGRAALDAQARLAAWKPLLDALTKSGQAATAFNLPPIAVDCGFRFGGNKEVKIELIKRDRLAAPASPETREEIMTVVCSSPLSVSGGFAVSSLDRRAYGLVTSTRATTPDGVSTTAAVSRVGLTEDSTSRTVPLLLVNTRLWEPIEALSVQFSAGAAVDPGTGKTGTEIEYIFGGTIAFARELFITVGWHLSHHDVLTGGFQLDDEVPEGLTAPTVQKQRNTGAILAITFRLR